VLLEHLCLLQLVQWQHRIGDARGWPVENGPWKEGARVANPAIPRAIPRPLAYSRSSPIPSACPMRAPRLRLPRRRNCLLILALLVVAYLGLTAIHGHWMPPPPVFGVEPALYHAYAPIPRSSPPSWSCLNDSSHIIPFSAINDDYCDCPDGSDEPGTSACRSGWFFCHNSGGNTGRRIPSYSVSDGLCGMSFAVNIAVC